MRELGLRGVIRGKPVRTTISDKAAPYPLDHVNRHFHAPTPNRLWDSDFTYVATWAGFAYIAFVIDVYARYIVGWRVRRTAHASFVLDALKQAIHDRRPVHRGGHRRRIGDALWRGTRADIGEAELHKDASGTVRPVAPIIDSVTSKTVRNG